MNANNFRLTSFLFYFMFFSVALHSQSAVVEYESTNKGILIPRMTAAQRIAIVNPATGLMVYDLSSNQFMFYNGSSWNAMSGGNISLPYYNETSVSQQAFHIHNESTLGYGLAGTIGQNAEILLGNRAGVIGQGNNAHGVLGISETSFYAGVYGVSNSTTGRAVMGYGFGGGTGGHFYTTSTGRAALSTGVGNVGIGTEDPEHKMHVAGNLFVQSNLGRILFGFPNNGSQWQFSTIGSGADLLFRSKFNGANTITTRFSMKQTGEFIAGTTNNADAWMNIYQNSQVAKPHLKLTEVGNDYARLELSNTVSSAYWQLAGLASTTSTSGRMNFYFHNGTAGINRMTLTGDGKLGINGTPTARLHLHQGSQNVGTGLRFKDNTNNADWDITHGFGLRFHYGGNLKGLINANTGAYTVSSDKRLKTNIKSIGSVLEKVKQLRVSSYQYKDAQQNVRSVGLLAQEVSPLFPELVSYSKADDLYGVNYGGFSVIALKAIQEQQDIIDDQQQTISSLEKRLSKLETMLSTMQKGND